MEVYKFIGESDTYSVPFDWDDDDQNIEYLESIIEQFFDVNLPVGDAWQPTFFGTVNPRMKTADIGTLAGSEQIVFNQRAVDVLKPLLGDSVELLPYPTEVGIHYFVNVLDVGYYLDRQRTECDEILPNGICYGINKYVFHENLLRGKHIFRIQDEPIYRFVSGNFITTCLKNKLTGIDFTNNAKVWDSNIM